MALERELSEEIGDCFRVVRPAVVAENFFDLDGISFHERCTFYDVDFIDDKGTKTQSVVRVTFVAL